MKKNIFFAVTIFLSLILSGCTNFNQQTTNQSANNFSNPPQTEIAPNDQLVDIQINDAILKVEVVDQIADIERGLGYRDEIGSDGMLFVLPQRQVARFWMMGMRFPLDMVWIDQGKVIGVTADVPIIDPELDLSRNEPPVYLSPGVVTHVLELNVGQADQLGINRGDKVILNSN